MSQEFQTTTELGHMDDPITNNDSDWVNIPISGDTELNPKEDGYVNNGFENDDGKSSHHPKDAEAAVDNEKLSSIQEDENDTGRQQWDNQIEFLMSCISMSVGLGNVWRFPFTAYENGGGAFLIPYLIVLFLVGKPIYYLELCLGQFSSKGQLQVWNVVPFFKGVGYGSMIGTVCVVSYYCSLMAITIFYFINSFQKVLPWARCGSWAEEYCIDGEFQKNMTDQSLSELYFGNEAFVQYKHVRHGIGAPEWRLTICLFVSWLLICLSLIKGVQSSGKVAYFTAIFPYVVLFILLIRGLTLDGAWDGVYEFINPDWSKIYDPKVWYAAVGQCFFSLATGFGTITFLSSFNPFRHNVYRDAFIISLMDTFTSLLAGVTIFAILGNLWYENPGLEFKDVVRSGPGLAFVSYPDVISKFDGSFLPQLFAVLFFVMLFTLGMGTTVSLTGGLITIICDQWPSLKKWMVTIAVCIWGFLVGLIYVTPGGQFLLTLVDYFGANFVIYVMAMLEVFAISWVYGLDNFCRDIEFMLGIKVSWYWRFCWGYFIPFGLLAILVYVMVTQERLEHNGVPFPDSAIAAGWELSAIAVLVLPLCAFHAVYTRKGTNWMERLKESVRPTENWGPKNAKLKAEWIIFKQKTG